MTPSQLGAIKGLGVALLTALLVYLGDVSHWNGLVSPAIAGLLSALALSLEAYIEGKGGGALFGAVSVRK